MWMPTGSFWTQPVGEAHITSAKGTENIAYVEIDQGPYLVKPISEAFDSGERPVNIDATNVVWLDATKSNWIAEGSTAAISFLWESTKEDGLKGGFLKIPVGFSGQIDTDGEIVHAIIIAGEMAYKMPEQAELVTLDIGSYFGSEGKAIHEVANREDREVIIYVRTNGGLRVE